MIEKLARLGYAAKGVGLWINRCLSSDGCLGTRAEKPRIRGEHYTQSLLNPTGKFS